MRFGGIFKAASNLFESFGATQSAAPEVPQPQQNRGKVLQLNPNSPPREHLQTLATMPAEPNGETLSEAQITEAQREMLVHAMMQRYNGAEGTQPLMIDEIDQARLVEITKGGSPNDPRAMERFLRELPDDELNTFIERYQPESEKPQEFDELDARLEPLKKQLAEIRMMRKKNPRDNSLMDAERKVLEMMDKTTQTVRAEAQRQAKESSSRGKLQILAGSPAAVNLRADGSTSNSKRHSQNPAATFDRAA